MPEKKNPLILRQSKEMFIARMSVSVLLAGAAIYGYFYLPVVVVVLFATISILHFTFGLLGRRRYVRVENSHVTIQSFRQQKTIDIAHLQSAGYVDGTTGIFLKNKEDVKANIPMIFSKKDLMKLLEYLRPYVMSGDVDRDKGIEKLYKKYPIAP